MSRACVFSTMWYRWHTRFINNQFNRSIIQPNKQGIVSSQFLLLSYYFWGFCDTIAQHNTTFTVTIYSLRWLINNMNTLYNCAIKMLFWEKNTIHRKEIANYYAFVSCKIIIIRWWLFSTKQKPHSKSGLVEAKLVLTTNYLQLNQRCSRVQCTSMLYITALFSLKYIVFHSFISHLQEHSMRV